MWDHRLGREWGRRSTGRELFAMAIRNPPRFLLNEVYREHYARRAARDYVASYELGPDILCRLREPKARDAVSA